MVKAIISHFFVLGIVVKNDSGELFILAIGTLICCLMLIYNQKNKIYALLHFKI